MGVNETGHRSRRKRNSHVLQLELFSEPQGNTEFVQRHNRRQYRNPVRTNRKTKKMIPTTYRSVLVDQDGVVVHQQDLEGRIYKVIEKRAYKKTDEKGNERVEITYTVKVSPWKQLKMEF